MSGASSVGAERQEGVQDEALDVVKESERIEKLFGSLAQKDAAAADVRGFLERLELCVQNIRGAVERDPQSRSVDDALRTLRSCNMMHRIMRTMDHFLDDGAIQLGAIRLVYTIFVLFTETNAILSHRAMNSERGTRPDTFSLTQQQQPQQHTPEHATEPAPSRWIYSEIVGNDVIQLLVEALVQYASEQILVETVLRLITALAFCDVECRSLLGDFGALDGIAQVLDAFHSNPEMLQSALDTMHVLLGWPMASFELHQLATPRGSTFVARASASVICSVCPQPTDDGSQNSVARELRLQNSRDLQRIFPLPEELKLPSNARLPIGILVSQYKKSSLMSGSSPDWASSGDGEATIASTRDRNAVSDVRRDAVSSANQNSMSRAQSELVCGAHAASQSILPLPTPLHEQNCARISSSGLMVRMLEIINNYTVMCAALRRKRKARNQQQASAKEDGVSGGGVDGGSAEDCAGEQVQDGGRSRTVSSKSMALSTSDCFLAEQDTGAVEVAEEQEQRSQDDEVNAKTVSLWRELAYRSVAYLSSGLAANKIGQKALRGAEGIDILLTLGCTRDRALRHAAAVCLRWSLAGNAENQEAFVDLSGLAFVQSSVKHLKRELHSDAKYQPCMGVSTSLSHDAHNANFDNIHLEISSALLLLYEAMLKSEANQELAANSDIVPFVHDTMRLLPDCVMVTSAGAAVLRVLSYTASSREQLFAHRVMPAVMDSLEHLSFALHEISSKDARVELVYNAAGVSEILAEHTIKTLLIMSSSRHSGLIDMQQSSARLANSCVSLLWRCVLRCSAESRNERNGVSSLLSLCTRFIDSSLRMLKMLTEDVESLKIASSSTQTQNSTGANTTGATSRLSPSGETSNQAQNSKRNSYNASARLFTRTTSAFTTSTGRSHSRGKVMVSADAPPAPTESVAEACTILFESDFLELALMILSLYSEDYFLLEQTLTVTRNVLRLVAPDVNSSGMGLLPATRRAELWDSVTAVKEANPKMAMVSTACDAVLERLDPGRYSALALLASPRGQEEFTSPQRGGTSTPSSGLFSRGSSVKKIVRRLSHPGRVIRSDSRSRSKSRANGNVSNDGRTPSGADSAEHAHTSITGRGRSTVRRMLGVSGGK